MRFGEYRVTGFLGEGGMGLVYEAMDERLNRPAAVKILHSRYAPDEEARRRFIREGQAMAALRSDHVVDIYRVDEQDGVLFLAMELLEGATLEGWLRARPGSATADEVLWVARDVLTGLSAAHAKGLIHRDIKPTNLWVEAGTGRVKMLDYGLSRRHDGADQITQPGYLVGTPAFMAPEQARGESMDARSDLFSVGVVLYRMAAGRSSFERGTHFDTLNAVSEADASPLAGLSPEVCRFIARLMAKRPEDRPTDAAAALAELQAVKPQAGVKRPGPPRKWLLWAAAAGAAARFAGIIIVIKDKNGDPVGELKLTDGAKATVIDTKTGKRIDFPPVKGGPRKGDGKIRVGMRVRVSKETTGYGSRDRERHLQMPEVSERALGLVKRIASDENLCEIELDKPAGETVWVLLDDVKEE